MEKTIGIALMIAFAFNLIFFPFNITSEVKADPDCVDIRGYFDSWSGTRKGEKLCRRIKEKRVIRKPAWDQYGRENFGIFAGQLLITSLIFGGVAYFVSDLSDKKGKGRERLEEERKRD